MPPNGLTNTAIIFQVPAGRNLPGLVVNSFTVTKAILLGSLKCYKLTPIFYTFHKVDIDIQHHSCC